MTIADNYQSLLEEIHTTALKSNRDPASITPVLVTKFQPVEKIVEAINCGALDFAENYPEKLLPKLPGLPVDSRIRWHMIGHLQSRKARIVCEHFDCFHSLDSLKLAQVLSVVLEETDRILPVMIEINLSGEETKHGFRVVLPGDYERLCGDIQKISKFGHLKVTGLMTMPPFTSDPETSREFFTNLRNLKERLNKEFPGLSLAQLSMGSSQDFKVGIEEGATFIRIGTYVFGERESQ